MTNDKARQLDYLTNLLQQGKVKDFGTAIARVRGEWTLTHKDLLGQEVVISSYREIVTQYGEALIAETLVNGEIHSVLIGAQVLIKQLRDVKDLLPIRAKVVKPGRYYEFESAEYAEE